jgi:hypothetical protein
VGRVQFQGLTAPAPFGRGEHFVALALPEAFESVSRSLFCAAHALKLCWIAFSEPSNGSKWLEKNSSV